MIYGYEDFVWRMTVNKQIINIINKMRDYNIHVVYVKHESYDAVNKKVETLHTFEQVKNGILIDSFETEKEKTAIDTLVKTFAQFLVNQKGDI